MHCFKGLRLHFTCGSHDWNYTTILTRLLTSKNIALFEMGLLLSQQQRLLLVVCTIVTIYVTAQNRSNTLSSALQSSMRDLGWCTSLDDNYKSPLPKEYGVWVHQVHQLNTCKNCNALLCISYPECNMLQIGQNMKAGMILKDKFKIVYVAPMKALAAEMTSTFSKRLGPLGMCPSRSFLFSYRWTK